MIDRRIAVPAAFVCLLTVSRAWAAGAGSSGAEFLRVAMGARAAALGENFTGLADDVTAAAWNPAGLAQLDDIQFSGMHLAYLGDISYEFLAASYPVGKWGSLAVSGIYMNIKPFDSTVPGSGAAVGTAADGMAAISWGGSFKPIFPGKPDYHNVSYGLTGKFIYRKLGGYQGAGGTTESFTATAFAGDIGLFYQAGPQLSWGAALQNLGSSISFLGDEADALPMTLRTGFGWRAYNRGWLRATALADLIKPVDPDGGKFESGAWGGGGLEVTVWDILSLRGGFRSGLDGTRVVGGGGVAYSGFSLDYAFIPLGNFGNGHRFGMTVKLPKVSRSPRRLPAVRNLAVEDLKDKRVALTWTPVKGAAGYHVGMRRADEGEFKRLTKAPRKAPGLSLRGLKPEREYAFQVIAVNATGREGPPGEVSYTVPALPQEAVAAAPVVLPAPKQLRAVSSASRKVTLTWTPVEGAAGYHVYYRRTGAGKKAWRKSTASPRTSTRAVLKGFGPRSYDFTVVTANSAGKGGKGARPVSVAVKP